MICGNFSSVLNGAVLKCVGFALYLKLYFLLIIHAGTNDTSIIILFHVEEYNKSRSRWCCRLQLNILLIACFEH